MRRMRRNGVDLVLYTAVLLLMTVGIVEVYSSSVFLADQKFAGEHAHFFTRQLVFSGMALISMLIFAAVPYDWFRKIVWVAVSVSVVLLAVVLFMPKINDASRWIGLGFLSLQPSEIFKYVMIYLMAHFLARDQRKEQPAWHFRLVTATVIIGLGLIVVEPDLGTVLVISMVLVGMAFVAGCRLRKVAFGAALLAGVAYVTVFMLGYKKGRILEYIESIKDPLNGAYQVKQSILYIGSGGLFGKGIGRGSAKLFFVPEVHTDFIFANFAEEGGFIWVTIMLVLFAVIFWRGLRVAVASQNRFGFFLGFGITMALTVSALINIAVTVSLIPTTGMPLPFVSYGGTSLLISASAVGMLLNISRRKRGKTLFFERHE